MAIYDKNNYNQEYEDHHYFAVNAFLLPFYSIFFKLNIIGKENIPLKKPYIVMANHLSNFDPPLVSAALNIPIAYMAKEELYQNAFVCRLIRYFATFSVNREKVEKTTIKAAKEILEKNWCIGVFLEGTRSKTPGKLGIPNSGPAFISNISKTPILPVGIIGSNKLFGPITVKIGNLFYPPENIEEGKWLCAAKLSELTGLSMPDKN